MHIIEVYEKIFQIALMKDPSQVIEQVRKLRDEIKRPKIMKTKRGNFVYFYQYEMKYIPEVKKSRRKNLVPLGKMEKERYEKRKGEIDKIKYPEILSYLKEY